MYNKTRDFNPFNRVQVEQQNSNLFDLSFDNKLSIDMGKLYPVLVQDVIPGDNLTITPEMLIRLAPMTFPIMHRIDATIHYFYVPNRIVWDEWKNFLAGEPGYHSVPYLQSGDTVDTRRYDNSAGSFLDYMGIPSGDITDEPINALPFLAFWRIVNEYYQDQNNDSGYLQLRDWLKQQVQMGGGLVNLPDFLVDTSPVFSRVKFFNRAWEHDYFTSALPFAQKGEAVNIPLQLAQLEGDVEVHNAEYLLSSSSLPAGNLTTDGSGKILSGANIGKLTGTATIDGAGAELAGTINQLRAAEALQRFLELNARSGTRYNELISAHFGVDTGDARVNRPEYIGGIQNNVVISEVLQTSQTDLTALGDYAGHGTAVVSGNTLNYTAKEHGFVIGILSVKPRTAYFQGLPRKFSKLSYLDYYWKQFAHIGEQAILNKELFITSDRVHDNATFGYIPRYSEYKYNPSEVHGDFKTNMLDWHLGRKFENPPVLNQEFIYCNSDAQNRIFAYTGSEYNHLYCHIFTDIKARRPIPFFTNPGI